MGELFELRPVQARALDMMRGSIRSGKKRPQLQLPCGTGKTVIAAHMATSAKAKGNRSAFTVPLLSLIDQTVERFIENGIDPGDIGVVQADHPLRRPYAPIQICSVMTLAKREFPAVDFIMVDECFAAGTTVETPFGQRPIETMKLGDLVFNAAGVGVVRGTPTRLRKTIEIDLTNGERLRVTPNHQFFTERGWVEAGALVYGEALLGREDVRLLREDLSTVAARYRISVGRATVLLDRLCRESETKAETEADPPTTMEGRARASGGEDMRLLWQGISSDQSRGGGLLEASEVLFASLRAGQNTQPDVFRRNSRKNGGDAQANWPWGESERWQREAASGATSGAPCGSGRGMDGGVGCIQERDAADGFPVALQDRLSQPRFDDGGRSRRFVASEFGAQGVGQEKGCVPPIIRVERISSEERGGAEPVYDLRVGGHPSYFAGGVLVHNSHIQYKIIYDWQDECPKKIFVGLSATPWAVGMGLHYDDLLIPATTKELIASGDLCSFKAFAPSKPDLSGIKMVAGDYHEGQLSERMRDKVLTADIVETWLMRAEGRPTMLFAVDRAHAAKLHDQFCAMGVKSAYVDAFTEREERAAVKSLFHKGEIKVVCSVGTMTHGVDWDVRCVQFCRPTKSPILYMQCVGRGLRNAPDKQNLLLLDHSNATLELGLPTEIHFTELLGGKKREGGGAKPARKLPSPRECPECGEIVAATERHCRCGHAFRFWSRIEAEDGELQEIGARRAQARLNREWTMEAKARFFGELKHYGMTHGYKRAWLVHKYVERLGVKPWSVWNAPLVQPGYETLAWIRHAQIAWARSQPRESGR